MQSYLQYDFSQKLNIVKLMSLISVMLPPEQQSLAGASSQTKLLVADQTQ